MIKFCTSLKSLTRLAVSVAVIATLGFSHIASAATAEDLDNDTQQALQQLYKTNPFAEKLAHESKAIWYSPRSSRPDWYSAAAMAKVSCCLAVR